jgi:hypothetical protein
MDFVKPSVVKDIVKHYYNMNDICIDKLDNLTTNISPALVQSVCNKHKNIYDCINELLTYYSNIITL